MTKAYNNFNHLGLISHQDLTLFDTWLKEIWVHLRLPQGLSYAPSKLPSCENNNCANLVSRTKRADLFIVCYRSAGTSAADLQKIYRLSTDYLQIICRMSAEYLQNICRMPAAMFCNKSANLQMLCRQNQHIMLNKKPTKCTNQATFI